MDPNARNGSGAPGRGLYFRSNHEVSFDLVLSLTLLQLRAFAA
jgi:hypothetical protein